MAVAVNVNFDAEMLVLDFCVVLVAVDGWRDDVLAAYELLKGVRGSALTFEDQMRGAAVGNSE